MSHLLRSSTRMPAYPPMSREGYIGLCEYVTTAVKHDADPNSPPPNIELLRRGIPQGSILGITPDLGLQVSDTSKENALRTPRGMDPLGVALSRALVLPGGSLGINRKKMGTPNRLDYLHYRTSMNGKDPKVPLHRIITDAQPGSQTPSADDYTSCRRGDLLAQTNHVSSRQLTREGKPTKSPYRGRRSAIEMALHTFDKNKHKLDFDISRAEYIRMLRTILRLLDKIPLKTARP